MIVFLYTNNERSEREIIETIPFTMASKRIKYLGINLLKETKDLYSENYMTLKKEIKGDTHTHKQMERYTMFFNWKNQYCQNDYTTQGNLQSQCNPVKLPRTFFTEQEWNILKFVWKRKRCQIVKEILKKKNINGVISLPDFRQY